MYKIKFRYLKNIMQLNTKNCAGKWRRRVVSVTCVFTLLLGSCSYLDIVPDNIATVDNAFKLRNEAEKYLFTCYSYLPKYSDVARNPALTAGDEVWFYYPYKLGGGRALIPEIWEVARGNQNINNPYLNYWDGSWGGSSMFEGIRDCNIFLENIEKVPDLTSEERARWISEVMFLKAYYHWYLLRMYGPIPITDKNLPVSSSVEEVRVARDPVDECFSYIVNLLDSAVNNLPEVILNPVSEMGRITQPIALSVKASVLMNAASPLFNGNTDYKYFIDKDGEPFFNQTYDPKKWELAAEACAEAIEACENMGGNKLYYFSPAVDVYKIGPEMRTQLSIRNAITEKWNSEIIWGSTNSLANQIQNWAQAIVDPSTGVSGNRDNGAHAQYGPPLKIVEMYYTKNGVPIDEDKDWDYQNRYDVVAAKQEDSLYIYPGYETAKLHFNREPRFYAGVGFDGGMWFGSGKNDEADMWHVENRLGSYSGRTRGDQYSITGYYAKKLVHFLNLVQPDDSYQVQTYPWPVIRLADLYLYYAEALNEIQGSTPETLKWINKVRERAGLLPVEEAWPTYSIYPDKYSNKDGLREIIHQERLIEMAFEGSRFWDIRRWKKAETIFSQPITGWAIGEELPMYYYQKTVLFKRNFVFKDYLWPIKENNLIINKNLIQNPGW